VTVLEQLFPLPRWAKTDYLPDVSSVSQNQQLHFPCVYIRRRRDAPTSAIVIDEVLSTIFEPSAPFPDKQRRLYVKSIQLYQLAVNFDGGNICI
jgi:hypothetical protein